LARTAVHPVIPPLLSFLKAFYDQSLLLFSFALFRFLFKNICYDLLHLNKERENDLEIETTFFNG
jgi:hypothetical protein